MLVVVELNASELVKGDIVVIPNTNTRQGIFIESDSKWAYFNEIGKEHLPPQYYNLGYHFRIVDPVAYVKNRL